MKKPNWKAWEERQSYFIATLLMLPMFCALALLAGLIIKWIATGMK